MKKIFQKTSGIRIQNVDVNPWHMPTSEPHYEVTIDYTDGIRKLQILSTSQLKEVQATWKKGIMIPTPLSPWVIKSHLVVTRSSFMAKEEYKSMEVLAPLILERLQTLAGWAFEQSPEEGLIKAFYLGMTYQTDAHILFHKDADKIIIEVNRLGGDSQPLNHLKAVLKETFSADVPNKKAKKAALIPETVSLLTPEQKAKEYLENLKHMTKAYRNNISMLSSDIQYVLKEIFNESHSYLLDNEACRNQILSIIKHALVHGPDSLALLACEQLYKRPSYQTSFLTSPTLLSAIYQNACCNETYHTAKMKEISMQLLSKLLEKDDEMVLKTLQQHTPEITIQNIAEAAGQTVINLTPPSQERLDSTEGDYDECNFGNFYAADDEALEAGFPSNAGFVFFPATIATANVYTEANTNDTSKSVSAAVKK